MTDPITANPCLTLAEIEALTLFLAEKYALWNRHALNFGVADPMRLAKELARVHAQAVRRAA